jgi:hypothetical protein
MTVAEINQRIAVANAESKRLNNERQVNIGKRETLTSQLQTALEKYEKDYGVKLTVENLQTEIANVSSKKEKELAQVEQMLTLIKEGKFDEAQTVANPQAAQEKAEQTAPTTPTVSAPTTPTEPQVAPPSAPTVPTEPTVATPPIVPTTPTEPQIAPPTPSAPKMNLSGIDALEGFVTPPTPSAPTAPTTPQAPTEEVGESPITSFSAILGGSQFAPSNFS